MASDSGAQAGSSGQALFHRLIRSLSGHTTPSPPSAAPPPSTTAPEEPAMPASSSTEPSSPPVPSPASGEPLQRVASASSSIKKARMKIADRLKQLGKDIGKLRRGNSKSVPASPRVTVGEVTHSTEAPPAEHSGHARLLSMVAEQDEPEGTVRANANDPPSAMTLAKRIQSLIDALPFPTGQKGDIPVPKNPGPPAQDNEGHPIFPPNATPVKDSNLISLLSSPTIMNGSTVKGRPSIWSVLEALGVPPHGFPPTAGEENAGGTDTDQSSDSTPVANPLPVLSDDTSILLYSPLFPGEEDLVELGEQVPITVDEVVSPTSWTSVWPLSIWYNNAAESKPSTSTESAASPPKTSVDSQGRVVKVQTVQAWVPSKTKLSVQALWWGYRLYLPPPVLAILGDQTLEATKRAAIITTALTWFFNNLPVTALPPPLQPAALLLQRLAPYLGYIGTFISWSWSAIKSYDVGYGVILSATWLLPVALIPSTWKQNAFPMSPSQSTPAPLPPQTPSSPPTSLPTSPSAPSTTPTSPSTPLTSTPKSPPTATTRLIAQIPVAPSPAEETIPPVPPVPSSPGVPPDSPLGEQLLHGPLMSPVPLPDENEPSPQAKPKKDMKSRTKALFMRSPKA